MTKKNMVGFDGTHFFCMLCGKTFPTKQAVHGHRRACQKNMSNVVQVKPTRKIIKGREILENFAPKMAQIASQVRKMNLAGSWRPQLESQPQPNEPQRASQVSKLNLAGSWESQLPAQKVASPQDLFQVAQILQRIHQVEQQFSEMQKYVYNETPHMEAIEAQKPWFDRMLENPIVRIVLFGFASYGAYKFAEILVRILSEQSNRIESTNNPNSPSQRGSGGGEIIRKIGSQFVGKVVDRGANKVVNGFFG